MPRTSTRGIFLSELGCVDNNFDDRLEKKLGWRTARRMNTRCGLCLHCLF